MARRLCRLEARRRPQRCEIIPPGVTLAEAAAAWGLTEAEAADEMARMQRSINQARRLFGLARGKWHEGMLVTAVCYYLDCGVCPQLYETADAWRGLIESQGVVVVDGGTVA